MADLVEISHQGHDLGRNKLLVGLHRFQDHRLDVIDIVAASLVSFVGRRNDSTQVACMLNIYVVGIVLKIEFTRIDIICSVFILIHL